MHEAFTLTTPALLFSAISLILLAYTNRFVAYTGVVRNLHKQYKESPSTVLKGQIYNLRKRLYLIRTMQILGVTSLFLCVITMFLIFFLPWMAFKCSMMGSNERSFFSMYSKAPLAKHLAASA